MQGPLPGEAAILRIHFESEDLARTTLASTDVLWEILLGLHTLQERSDEAPFHGWRRRTLPLIPADIRPLFEIAPPRGYSADFLTPTRGQADLDEGIEEFLATSRRQLHDDFSELARQGHAPLLARSVGADTAPVVRRMAESLRTFHDIALAPYWTHISRDIEADRTRRLRTLGEHGIERLLGSLHPSVRWEHPVLHVRDYIDQDLHLRGRGLVLIPSFFNRHHPVTLKDPERPPLLIFPISQRSWALRPDHDRTAGALALADLLGRTRTTVLETTKDGCSTTGLAQAADISLASVSHHTKVLRAAGLITTRRDGRSVRHEITELGLALLESTPAGEVWEERPQLSLAR